jgi:hypothetical protein
MNHKNHVIPLMILVILFSACSPAAAASTQPTSAPQATEPVIPPPTPAPTLPPAVLTVDQKVEAYLNGKIDDIGDLSSQELAEFSNKVTERKNADRGVNVLIYDNGSGNPVFIDPSKGNMMVEYDGVANLDKTIEMFVPIAGKDEQGNLQFEVDGQLVTIGASAGVDWDMRVTEYGDQRIEWPIEEIKSHGMTNIEKGLETNEPSKKKVIIPTILLKKNLGQLQITGVPTLRSTLSFLIPETDAEGQPLYARKIIVVGGPTFSLYEEGSDFNTRTSAVEPEHGLGFSQALKFLNENWTYYLGPTLDQDYIYGGLNKEYLYNYKGLISSSDSMPILLGEKHNDKDMLSLANTLIIKAKVKN